MLDVEDSFCYLGYMLGAGGGCTQTIIARCGVAWGKFRKLLPVLTSRHLPFKVKGRVYNSCVRLAILHGSETWGPRESDLTCMKRSDRAMMRLICRIRSNEPSTTEILCAKLGLAEICSEVRARQLRWYGHVKRLMATQSSWAYTVSEHEAPGDAGRGAPCMTWSKCGEGFQHLKAVDCGSSRQDTLERESEGYSTAAYHRCLRYLRQEVAV